MRFWDKLSRWIGPDPRIATSRPPRQGPALDAEGLRELLRAVIDPELGIDIVSMGLIRDIVMQRDEARVTMTLSTPGCPVGPLIVSEVQQLVRMEGLRPRVELVFDPPWTPDDILPQARGRIR